MAKSIWKYTFNIKDSQAIYMPQGGKILTVQMQHFTPTLWVEIPDTSAPHEPVFIEVFGTGNAIMQDIGIDRSYIGTIQEADGILIWHIYQRHH